jgi:hypothetical protein
MRLIAIRPQWRWQVMTDREHSVSLSCPDFSIYLISKTMKDAT